MKKFLSKAVAFFAMTVLFGICFHCLAFYNTHFEFKGHYINEEQYKKVCDYASNYRCKGYNEIYVTFNDEWAVKVQDLASSAYTVSPVTYEDALNNGVKDGNLFTHYVRYPK